MFAKVVILCAALVAAHAWTAPVAAGAYGVAGRGIGGYGSGASVGYTGHGAIGGRGIGGYGTGASIGYAGHGAIAGRGIGGYGAGSSVGIGKVY